MRFKIDRLDCRNPGRRIEGRPYCYLGESGHCGPSRRRRNRAAAPLPSGCGGSRLWRRDHDVVERLRSMTGFLGRFLPWAVLLNAGPDRIFSLTLGPSPNQECCTPKSRRTTSSTTYDIAWHRIHKMAEHAARSIITP
jgi:hypothetical protein